MDNLIQFLQPQEVALLQQEPRVDSAKQFNSTMGSVSGQPRFQLTVDRKELGYWLTQKGYGSDDLRLLPVAKGKIWAEALTKAFLTKAKALGGTGISTHFELAAPICNVYAHASHGSSTDGPQAVPHKHRQAVQQDKTEDPKLTDKTTELQRQQEAEAERLRLARLLQQQALEAEERKKREKKRQEMRRQRIRAERASTQATYYARPRQRQMQDDGPDL